MWLGTRCRAKQKATYEVIVDVLDVLAEVIYRFAGLITAHQQALLDALLPNLLYPRPLVRKRAVLALGTCAPSQRWRCH